MVQLSNKSVSDKYNNNLKCKTLRIGFDYHINIQENSNHFIKVFTSYISTLLLIITLQIQVPQGLRDLQGYIDGWISPLSSLSSSYECLSLKHLSSSFFTKKQTFLLAIQISFFLIIVFFCILQVIYNAIAKSEYLTKNLVHCVFVVFFYAQIQILISSFQLLAPVRVYGSNYFIEGDLELEYSNVTNLNNLIVVIPTIVVWIGTPLAFLFVLRRGYRRGSLAKPKSLSAYTKHLFYFYANYPVKYYYWDFVRMVERIVITIAVIVFSNNNNLKGTSIVIVVALQNVFYMYKKPYSNLEVRDMELLCGVVQIVNVICLLALYENDNVFFQYFFMVGFFASNMSFAVYSLFQIAKSYVKKYLIKMSLSKRFRKWKCVKKYKVRLRRRMIAIYRWRNLKLGVNELLSERTENS